jgi:hypothetical protein
MEQRTFPRLGRPVGVDTSDLVRLHCPPGAVSPGAGIDGGESR